MVVAVENTLNKALNYLQKDLSEKELSNLFKNFNLFIGKISELEVNQYNDLIEDISGQFEEKYRVLYPSIATKIYGKKDTKVSELLENALNKLKIQFDLNNDEYVKTGGDMLSGRKYICRYISYRNNKKVCFLGLSQKTINDPIVCRVRSYIAYNKDKSGEMDLDFPFESFHEALHLYTKLLSKKH